MNNEGNHNRFGVGISNSINLGRRSSIYFAPFLQIRRPCLIRQKLNINSELLILKQLSWNRKRGRITDGKQDRHKHRIQNEDNS